MRGRRISRIPGRSLRRAIAWSTRGTIESMRSSKGVGAASRTVWRLAGRRARSSGGCRTSSAAVEPRNGVARAMTRRIRSGSRMRPSERTGRIGKPFRLSRRSRGSRQSQRS